MICFDLYRLVPRQWSGVSPRESEQCVCVCVRERGGGGERGREGERWQALS